MPKTFCKSLRKDGEPCQALGQEQFGGYCLAHASTDKKREWRSKGGKASSAVARADRRIPDRLRRAIEMLIKGMEDLDAGKIEPAALSAMSRAVRELVNIYRLADEEMDQIRDEESAAAAAQAAGGLADLELIEKADAMAAKHKEYLIESLVEQGLATQERPQAEDADDPPVVVLTTAGRRRFRYQRLTGYRQTEIDDWRNLVTADDRDPELLPAALYRLHKIRMNLEELLTDFDPDAQPVLDPLSGQPLTRLPAGVKPAAAPFAGPDESAQAAQTMQDMLRKVNELIAEADALHEEQFGEPFDIRNDLEQEDRG